MRGDIDNLRYNYDKMEVQLIGRDLGGRLYDSPVILKGSEEVNRTPLEIAQAFASDTGLSFVGPKTLPTMSTVGYKYLSNEAFKSLTPVRKWDFLVQLARNVGFQVYTTPKGELVFAPPDQTQQPIVYTWFADPHDTTLAPVKNLRVNYEPRRNKTFQVLILSYHPKTVSLESATTVILDQTIPFFKNKTVKEGFWHGAAGANIRSAFGQRLEGKPVYLFYVQGMTPQECEERADAMAKEISARQYTVEGSITSDLRLTPNAVVQLNGPIDNFKGQKLYVTGLTYRFGLHYGLQADFTALFVPPEPQAASVDPFG